MKFDIAHRVAVRPAFDALVGGTSTILDTKGYSAVAIMLMLGTLVGAGDASVTFEHGDESDLSDSEIVPADEIIGKITFEGPADNDGLMRLGYIGAKRYLQAEITPNGVTDGDGSGVWVLGDPDSALQDRLPSDVLPDGN